MNNALLYLGGLLITALAVLFAAPRFVDWNSYRGVFEEEASRILGREVRVGGTVNVRLLPAPYVSFERLRIADLGEDGGNSIIRIESFTMWLSVPPLLRGVLEAHRVELRRPVISLAINEDGTGNWRSLAITPGAFPFAPKEVALQSVEINDGAVIISGPSRSELTRFDAINGEFTADALEGPYKFKGAVGWNGAPRRFRLSTAKIDANGDLRFKAAVDVTGSANSYVLDGRLAGLKESPTLEGDLTAKLALSREVASAAGGELVVEPEPAPANGGASVPPAPEPAAKPSPPPVPEPAAQGAAPDSFELKSKVTGTAHGVELKDIQVSLEAGATPQLITGEASFGWGSKTRLDVALKSQWLDLDRIAHATKVSMPLEAARSYFEALASVLPMEADTNARLDFDQLTLGGEPISNVHLAAARSGGPLELKGVRADLPGGVRLELDGILTPTANVPRLDGSLFISGRSLMRFLAWGLDNPEIGRDRNDGAFRLDGKFALGDGTLALTDTAAELAGTPLKGELRLDLGDRKKLAVSIEGPRVDVAQIGSGLVGLDVLQGLLFGTHPTQAATNGQAAEAPLPPGQAADGQTGDGQPVSQPKSRLLDPATADLSLDLKVGALIDGSRVLNDFDTVVRLERGKLSISRVKFTTPDGLFVEAEGEATDVPANPKGAIRGLVLAPNAAAARTLLALLDTDGTAASELDRLSRLAPIRLAGSLDLGGSPANASALSVDGTVGGGRLTATLRLEGGRSEWRSSPFDVQASVDSPNIEDLLAALFDARIKVDQPTSGRAIIKATGVPATGLLAYADVTADGLALGYRGQVRLQIPGDPELDGDLKISARDARVPLALAGLSVGGAAGTSLGGNIHVRREKATLKLDSDAITLGASTLSGQVALTSRDGGQTIDAALTADTASFGALLAPILASGGLAAAIPAPPEPQPALRGQVGRAAEAYAGMAAELPAVIWPEHSFDLSLLDRLDGKIALRAGSLSLEPGLGIANARIEADLSPTAIKVVRLDGDAVGGRLRSQIDLNKAPAGIALSGSLRIDIASKPPPPEVADPPPGDAVAFAVSFSSRGLSPAGLMATLSGKGDVTVGDATLNGNSPAAVAAVARAALTGKGPGSGNALTEAIKASLKEGEVKLGKLSIPAQISDGALKLDKVQIDMSEGRSTFVTAVELATMKVDSEWQIESKIATGPASKASRALLPPVTVVYAGKLSAFASLVPNVSAGALERELVVRKLEFDVGELERLRKLDEERSRREAERRKALEEDQPQPVPAPAPPAGAGGADYQIQSGSSSSFEDPAAAAVTRPEAELAAPQVPPPSPAAQRPRRKRPVEEEWRPFQTP